MKVVLEGLTKIFPSRTKGGAEVIAVNDFNFEIPDGKLIGLLGPSGCGKSTALNLLCGLQKPTRGKIFFGEDEVTNLPAENRGVGMVFQNYALYPHLTVLKNITFPLENLKGAAKMTKEDMVKKAHEVAKLVQIDELIPLDMLRIVPGTHSVSTDQYDLLSSRVTGTGPGWQAPETVPL